MPRSRCFSCVFYLHDTRGQYLALNKGFTCVINVPGRIAYAHYSGHLLSVLGRNIIREKEFCRTCLAPFCAYKTPMLNRMLPFSNAIDFWLEGAPLNESYLHIQQNVFTDQSISANWTHLVSPEITQYLIYTMKLARRVLARHLSSTRQALIQPARRVLDECLTSQLHRVNNDYHVSCKIQQSRQVLLKAI